MEIERILSKRGYVVTEDGTLLNPKGNKIGSKDNRGYIGSEIKVEGKGIPFFAHRLQAFQKYSNLLYEKGIVTRHLNGNKEDNSWDNIAIGTHSDNMMDIPEQIRIKKAKYAASFIKKYDYEEVINFYKSCKSYKKTMQEFNISSKGTLNYILNSSLK